LRFTFNDHEITPARVEHFYGGLVSYTAARGGLPERINTHYWFHFDLQVDWLQEGENSVQVTMTKHFDELEDDRVLLQVELEIRYVEPAVPQAGQM
jgi:hypothetical protein